MSSDKAVMRHTLLASILDAVAANARWTDRQALFEISKVYLPQPGQKLPDEPTHLAIAITGRRSLPTWQEPAANRDDVMDFYDLKGVIESLLQALHLPDAKIEACEHTSFFPGRTACVSIGGKRVGTFGELHPLVAQAYELPDVPVLVAELDLEPLLVQRTTLDKIMPVSTFPAVYQDIALVVPESTAAGDIEAAIRQAGGSLLRDVRLFDVYRSDQHIGPGNKSLAYALTFQADDKTLLNKDADSAREKIRRALENRFGAKLRS
jgi:phenylalanyl-tRNA synthetase beta chain